MKNKTKGVLKNDFPLLAVIFAGVAIVLSQLKPLYTYFEKSKLSISLAKTAQLSEEWGYGRFDTFVQIENSGGDDGLVASIDIYIVNKDVRASAWLFPVQYYFETPSVVSNNLGAPQIPFKSAKIPSGEAWGEYVWASEDRTSPIRDKVLFFTEEYAKDFEENYSPGVSDHVVWRPQEPLFNELVAFVENNSKRLIPGQYSVLVTALDKKGIVLCYVTSQYVLSDRQVDLLRSIIDEYSYGGGVLWPPAGSRKFVVYLELGLPLSDSLSKQMLVDYLNIKNGK